MTTSSLLLPTLSDDTITFTGPFQVKTSKGVDVAVKSFCFERNSYCLDIVFTHELNDSYAPGAEAVYGGDLCHDPVYLNGLNALLRQTGYEGPESGRAEMGMQEDDSVTLECADEFNLFAVKNGWWTYADGNDEFWLNRALREKLPGNRYLGFVASTGAHVGVSESAVVEAWVHARAAEPANKGKSLLSVFEDQVLPAVKADPVTTGRWAQANLDKCYIQVVKAAPEVDPRLEFGKAILRVL